MNKPLRALALTLAGIAALFPMPAALLMTAQALLPHPSASLGIGSLGGGGGGWIMLLLVVGCTLAAHAVAQHLARSGGANVERLWRMHAMLSALTILAVLVMMALSPAVDVAASIGAPPGDGEQAWWWWQRGAIGVSAALWLAQASCVATTMMRGVKALAPRRSRRSAA
jgi:hypothetical protein